MKREIIIKVDIEEESSNCLDDTIDNTIRMHDLAVNIEYLFCDTYDIEISINKIEVQ